MIRNRFIDFSASFSSDLRCFLLIRRPGISFLYQQPAFMRDNFYAVILINIDEYQSIAMLQVLFLVLNERLQILGVLRQVIGYDLPNIFEINSKILMSYKIS